MAIIVGNSVGGASPLKTLILEDPSGLEITGVVTENEQVFNATPNDVRTGCVCVTGDGVITGTKDIPAYRTRRGYQIIEDGSNFTVNLPKYDAYDYTQLQCMIAPFNTTVEDSVLVDKIVLNDSVFTIGSTESVSNIIKNAETQSIDFGITNNSGKSYIIFFFTYKEEQ